MRNRSGDAVRFAGDVVRRGVLRRRTAATARPALIARGLALAGMVCAAVAVSATPAMALSASHNVAIIPTNAAAEGPTKQDGNLPVSTTVAGKPSESFGKFAFTNVPLTLISASELAKFDTVVLNEVPVGELSTATRSDLAQFVANGGKLLIDDADATHNNDYSWV